MSRNVYFYYIKSTFFDIITNAFKSYDSKKTNSISFECPSRWVQNTRRTDFQLFQGLSHNLFFKTCVFTRKVAWQPLIKQHSWAWHILMPTSRAKRWGIICLCSLSGSLSNPLQSEIVEGVYEELRDRVYVLNFFNFEHFFIELQGAAYWG